MFSAFKPDLADLAVSVLAPIAAEMNRLMDDPGHIDGILAAGAERAAVMARQNIAEIHGIMGLGPVTGP
jgi:tryptophanyl-tRNA synthetase